MTSWGMHLPLQNAHEERRGNGTKYMGVFRIQSMRPNGCSTYSNDDERTNTVCNSCLSDRSLKVETPGGFISCAVVFCVAVKQYACPTALVLFHL